MYIAGIGLLLAVVIGAGVVYRWTFTPHGRLDLLFAVGLRLAAPPPPGTTPVEEERTALREILQWWGNPQPLLQVEDRRIPGPAGAIPIRVYAPSRADRLPILVFYHGGGFRLGDLDTYDALCRDLAVRSGAMIVSVEYRLAPEHVYPAAVDDSYAALVWVHAHAAEIGGDVTRLAVGGDSAGGNLAAAVSLQARDLGGPPLVFQLLIYPVVNFAEMETESHTLFAEGYIIGGAAHAFTRDTYLPNPADRRHPYASPLLARTHLINRKFLTFAQDRRPIEHLPGIYEIASNDLTGLPPALVITAAFDPLRDEGELYARKLAAAGVPARATRYAGVPHTFLYTPPSLSRKADSALDEAAAALRGAFDEGR